MPQCKSIKAWLKQSLEKLENMGAGGSPEADYTRFLIKLVHEEGVRRFKQSRKKQKKKITKEKINDA